MTTFVTENATDCPLTESQARDQLAGMIERAGLDVRDCWPMDRETVSAVLVANEYACNVDELHRLGRMKHIPNIESWDGKDLLCAVAALEARAQWQLTPSPLHDHKKCEGRRNLEGNIQAGPVAVREMLSKLSGFDFPFLLQLMIGADEREHREKLAVYMMAIRSAEALGIEHNSLPARIPAGDQFNTRTDDE